MKRMRGWLDWGLLFWFPLNTRGLTKDEIRRQRQLWKRNAQRFASGVLAETVFLDCGHYVHHYESESISRKILEFISTRI